MLTNNTDKAIMIIYYGFIAYVWVHKNQGATAGYSAYLV